MKLDPHEDKMRNKLSSLRINVDTDQLWSKLEAFVPEHKPRRPKVVFLLWPLLFLSISLGLILPYRYVSAFTLKTENFDFAAFENSKTSTIPGNLKDKNASVTTPVNKSQNLNTGISSESTNKSKSNNAKTKSYKSVVHAYPENKLLTTRRDESSNFSENSPSRNYTQHQHAELKPATEESRIIMQPFDKLNLLVLSTLSQKPHKTKKFKRIIRPQPRQIAVSLGMSAGAVIQQHLQAYTPEFDLLDKQKQTDTGRELMGIQLGITYPLSKNFYVRSGLNYTRAATQLSINENRYSRVLIEGIHGVWEDNQGNLHQVEGPVYATRKTNYQTRWTSYHHILDVPLSLGIRLLNYKRNLISIEAGATFHVIHKFQGAVWDAEFYLNKDASVADNFTHNRFSVRAAIEWEYRLSTTCSLFAGAQATDISLKNDGNHLTTEKRLYLINGIAGVKLYPGNM